MILLVERMLVKPFLVSGVLVSEDLKVHFSEFLHFSGDFSILFKIQVGIGNFEVVEFSVEDFESLRF